VKTGVPFREAVKDAAKIQEHLDARRNQETRRYTILILNSLERSGEWVSVRDLVNEMVPEHIPNESTFFRLLKDLYNEKIIDRKEDPTVIRRGKAPVYYKLIVSLPWIREDQLIPGPGPDPIARRYAELAIAKDLLRECGIDPDVAIRERFEKEYGTFNEPDTGESEEDPRMKKIRETYQKNKD